MIDPRLKLIFTHYGFPHQLSKLKEECLELVEAINNFQQEPMNVWAHVEEEMADVLNVLDQFCGEGVSKMRVDEIRDRKIERQLKRIEKGDDK